MKTFSLIKAVFSEDMNLFKVSYKKNNKLSKIILPLFLFFLISFMIADVLHEFNLTYIMVNMIVIVVTVLTFIEGIYKSQGILFNSKDDDLLFSLPIKKSQILFVRILKLTAFQYLFNLMFLLPAFVIYIYYEHPGASFYILSILMSVLVPIIPTIISSLIGYLIKTLSSKVKSKKLIETIFSLITFLLIYILSFNIDSFVTNLSENAKSVNEVLIKIYYPIGLYNNLIINFNILDLIKLLLVNIIPFVIFIVFGSKYYFKLVSKTKENYVKRKVNNEEDIYIKRSKIGTLIRKELKRYLSSPIYILNTCFGLLLCLVVTVALVFNESLLENLVLLKELGIDLPIFVIFYIFILFVVSMTEITASSISLEGKTINITKSLPVESGVVLKSKLYTAFIIEFPFLIISYFIFIVKFRINLLHSLFLIILIFASVSLVSTLGLIINLKYPKMNAKNDAEVVKQSMSAMVSTFVSMVISMCSVLLLIYLNKYLDINLIIILHLSLLIILAIISYTYLIKKGSIEYNKIIV